MMSEGIDAVLKTINAIVWIVACFYVWRRV